MIDIKRGDSNYRVSKGSYEIYFKSLGFNIVEPKQEKQEKQETQKVQEEKKTVKNTIENKSKKVGAK